jgi:hypothetical protein
MSYSLESKCGTCKKKDQCNDRHFIQGGISGIHDVWPAEKGHLGSGSVEIKCNQYVAKEA